MRGIISSANISAHPSIHEGGKFTSWSKAVPQEKKTAKIPQLEYQRQVNPQAYRNTTINKLLSHTKCAGET